MKKVLKLAVVSLMLFSFLIPYTAFAETDNSDTEWQDIGISQEEFYALLAENADNAITTYEDGLITTYAISMAQDGNKLTIVGLTRGRTDVTKCGFTKVTVQQRKNSSSSWSNYLTYTDLYADTFAYNLFREIFVPRGYQYRVTCTHYAKKNAFSTQTRDNFTKVYQF
ncbi:MAG: hypothetical protein K2I14_05690 [Eubacterium sp.]|nr:hypothetical protein [Eubacterium sp.]